jgi:hypothetical protein
MGVAYAAALALALLWGARAHHQTVIARAEAESLLRQLERVEQLADSPLSPPPSAPVRTAPVAAGQAQSDLELAGYTPHRGTF